VSTTVNRMRRLVTVMSAVVTCASIAAGCGVPIDSDDRPESRGNIPPDLLVPLPTSTTSTSTTAVPSTTIARLPTASVTTPPRIVDYPLDLYFASGDQLVLVRRRIGEPPTPDLAVAYLALGPREGEGVGLSTAVVDISLVVPTITVRDGRAEVELSDEFERLSPTQQSQMFNQLIATLTALPGVGVGAVQFFRNGAAQPVLRPDGELASGPQTRDDIARFIAAEIDPLTPVTTGPAPTSSTAPTTRATSSVATGSVPPPSAVTATTSVG
jgi:hypothetical protein